jgi:hypothetical protein
MNESKQSIKRNREGQPLEKLNGQRDEGGRRDGTALRIQKMIQRDQAKGFRKGSRKGTGMSVRRRRDGTALRIQKRIERGETDEGFRLPERSTLAMRIIGTSAACRK